jgi:uncharacterized membrane protein (GlpM family)
MNHYIFTFVFGGALTTLIVYCEVNGFPLISRMAALFPVFTWVSYLFIGKMVDNIHVAHHTLFVLLGTLFAWVPYMLFIYFLVTKLGTIKTLLSAGALFIVLALIFSLIYKGSSLI